MAYSEDESRAPKPRSEPTPEVHRLTMPSFGVWDFSSVPLKGCGCNSAHARACVRRGFSIRPWQATYSNGTFMNEILQKQQKNPTQM